MSVVFDLCMPSKSTLSNKMYLNEGNQAAGGALIKD